MSTLRGESLRTSGSERVNHAVFLSHFRELYNAQVLPVAMEALKADRRSLGRLVAPVTFTLRQRRNLFRTAFALALSPVTRRRDVGPVIAAAGEIAWSCALVVDDIIDGASEREGHPCAHLEFGTVRTAIAVFFSLWRTWTMLLRNSPVSLKDRFFLAGLSAMLLVRSLWSQNPLRRRPLHFKQFAKHARSVNISTHWPLVASFLLSRNSRALRAAWEYADAIAVGGKMRNDLLDYCGGSTESVTLYGDFKARRITFPVTILWQQPLTYDDRTAISLHFLKKRAPMPIERWQRMIRQYGVFDSCLALIRRQVEKAHAAIAEMENAIDLPPEAAQLLRNWTYDQIDVAEERVAAYLGAPCPM